ncbi:MAG: hypothetical protein JW893_08080 [Candidatus Omnitrophica bacterium]|nr:hypothetical protein [Candidatus Omnitrophota bacterium]
MLTPARKRKLKRLGRRMKFHFWNFWGWIRIAMKKRLTASHEIHIWHESASFQKRLGDLKVRNYRRAIILGNGMGLNKIDREFSKVLRHDSETLVIGLNRAYMRYEPDVLLWIDEETRRDILKHFFRREVLVIQTAKKDPYWLQMDYWHRNRNFRDFKERGLFFMRTILISALHLCFLLGVKEIILIGVDFDSRTYFFEGHPYYDSASHYEIADPAFIQKGALGYSTHRAVQEVIEYLIEKEHYSIRYTDESRFLSNIRGLQKVDVKNIYPNSLIAVI